VSQGVRSILEWLVAIALLGGGTWILAGPLQQWLGPRPWGTSTEAISATPPGVPARASSVALLVFLDGRELRVGQPQSALNALVDDSMADGPVRVAEGTFGDRLVRAYLRDGTRFHVVIERTEAGGPVRVSAIYLP